MDTTPFWRIALDWVPFLVFLALLFYFAGKMRTKQGSMMSQLDAHRERQHEEMRRLNANLERIAAALEKAR